MIGILAVCLCSSVLIACKKENSSETTSDVTNATIVKKGSLKSRAEQVTIGMTYKEVCELLGSEGKNVGSGMPIYCWKISLKQNLYVWLRDADTGSFDDWTVIKCEIGNLDFD